MSIRERLDKWIFERDLRLAKKRFERIRRSSVYNSDPRLKRRGYIKEILRAAGFKRIRMIEKS